MDSEDLELTACGHADTESAREGCPICNRATQVLGRLDEDAVITGQVPVGTFADPDAVIQTHGGWGNLPVSGNDPGSD